MTKEERKVYMKAYNKANLDKMNGWRKAYYAANIEKCRAYSRAYYAANIKKASHISPQGWDGFPAAGFIRSNDQVC